jgi:hypothetical protein
MTGEPSGLAPRVAGVARRRGGLGTPALAGLATFVAVLGGPGVPSALGQDEFLATWLWDVTTQNGDAIVEPGETATITLSIDFTPNVGEKGKTGNVINGLNFAVFDVLGGPGAANGTILGWTIDWRLTLILGDTTKTDGVSLFSTALANPVPFYVTDDPLFALSFEWAPVVLGEYDAHYESHTDQVWLDESYVPVLWDVREAVFSFQVIPGPSGLSLLVITVLCIPRRSRYARGFGDLKL